MKEIRTKLEAEMEAAKERYRKQLDDFKQEVWSDLPEMQKLQSGLRNLLMKLESVIARESNWNDDKPYEKLNESERQQILVNEFTVGALRVFLSDGASLNRQTLGRFYIGLARFYLGRFQSENEISDWERADVYAREAIALNEEAEFYRVRGVICLAKYRIVKANSPRPFRKDIQEQLNQLRKDAAGFLADAIKKNDKDFGAVYNLALAHSYEDKQDSYDEAIRVSKDAMQENTSSRLCRSANIFRIFT